MQGTARVSSQFGQQMPHRRQQQFVLRPEIVVGQRRRHAGAAGDFGHCDVQRPAIADRRNRRIDERSAAQRFHSDFGH
jgi:hypothetical protein